MRVFTSHHLVPRTGFGKGSGRRKSRRGTAGRDRDRDRRHVRISWDHLHSLRAKIVHSVVNQSHSWKDRRRRQPEGQMWIIKDTGHHAKTVSRITD